LHNKAAQLITYCGSSFISSVCNVLQDDSILFLSSSTIMAFVLASNQHPSLLPTATQDVDNNSILLNVFLKMWDGKVQYPAGYWPDLSGKKSILTGQAFSHWIAHKICCLNIADLMLRH
jgi:hypothetical protein